MPVPSLTEPTEVSTFQVPEIPSEEEVEADDDAPVEAVGSALAPAGSADVAAVGSAEAAATGGRDARETGAGPGGTEEQVPEAGRGRDDEREEDHANDDRGPAGPGGLAGGHW